MQMSFPGALLLLSADLKNLIVESLWSYLLSHNSCLYFAILKALFNNVSL